MAAKTLKPQKQAAITPPLKWAGGKRWFAANYKHLLPLTYRRYIEPFLGSGALFFSELPRKAYLSDANEELINFYRVIRSEPERLFNALKLHQKRHDTEYYYKIRELRPRTDISRAARTIYLNRTCWNGLYRVNLRGEFNVPRGTKDMVLFPTDDFIAVSNAMKNTKLECHDFEVAVDKADVDDFVFIDPPYTTSHNSNGFIKYNQILFSWGDQIRLRDAAIRAARRGAKVLVTNAAHEAIEELYCKDFEITHIARAGVIAGVSSARGVYREMVARCY